MNVFLAGGGGEIESKELDIFFIRTLKAKFIKRLIYLPIAADKKDYPNCLSWFKSVFKDKIDFIEPWYDLKGKSFVGLEQQAAVYIGGGDTGKLMSHIVNNGLADNLKKFVINGGVLYGGSAGAIILGKSLITAPEVKTSDSKYIYGLNLVNDYSIACHYDKTENSKTNLINLNKVIGSPIITLTEKGGLAFIGKRLYCFGKNETYIISKGKKSVLNNKSLIN